MASATSWFSKTLLVLASFVLTVAVVELETDQDGKPVWMQGEYRNRNEVPVPENYDAKRKHRDVSSEEGEEADISREKTDRKRKDKKGIIRTHFSMPFGVQMPLQYSEQIFHPNRKAGKKSKVPQSYKMARRAQLAKLSFRDAKGYYVPLDIDGHSSRSHVPSTWGMAVKNSNFIPETPRDSPGEMRSTMHEGFKLKEEDLDDGLMFRGLGGQGIRAQNEALIEGKFDEKMADEAEEQNSNRMI